MAMTIVHIYRNAVPRTHKTIVGNLTVRLKYHEPSISIKIKVLNHRNLLHHFSFIYYYYNDLKTLVRLNIVLF